MTVSCLNPQREVACASQLLRHLAARRQETVGQLNASATVIGPQHAPHREAAEPRQVPRSPRRSSATAEHIAHQEHGVGAAMSPQEARRSLAQSLRTLSDDEEYAAGTGCFWDSASSDRSSDNGLLALAGLSTQGFASAATRSPRTRQGSCRPAVPRLPGCPTWPAAARCGSLPSLGLGFWMSRPWVPAEGAGVQVIGRTLRNASGLWASAHLASCGKPARFRAI